MRLRVKLTIGNIAFLIRMRSNAPGIGGPVLMKTLKALTLATLERGESPAFSRRASLIRALEHQRALAKDGSYLRQVERLVPDADGVKSMIHSQKRVRPWWKEDVTGALKLIVRYGARPVELEKGKPIIVVASREQLVPTLDTVIAGVRAGELDEQLTQLAKTRTPSKPKRS